MSSTDSDCENNTMLMICVYDNEDCDQGCQDAIPKCLSSRGNLSHFILDYENGVISA